MTINFPPGDSKDPFEKQDNKTAFQQLEELSLEMTEETSNPFEAFAQWQQEREAFSDIHYDNERLREKDKRTKLVIAQAIATINRMELDANMFIKPATRAKIETFRLMCRNLADGRDLDERNDSDANQNP